MCGPSVVRAILAPSTISPLFPSRGGGVSIDAIVVLPVVVVASSADFRARCTLVSLSSNLCIDSSTDVYSARRNTSVSTVPSSPFFEACEKAAVNAVSSTSLSSFSSVFFRAAVSFARTKLRAHAITSCTRIASTVDIFSDDDDDDDALGRRPKRHPLPPGGKKKKSVLPMMRSFQKQPFLSWTRRRTLRCSGVFEEPPRQMKRKNLVLCLGFYILNVLKHYTGLFQTNKETKKEQTNSFEKLTTTTFFR